MYNIIHTHTHTHHAHTVKLTAAVFFSIFFLLSANSVLAIPQFVSVHGKLTDTLNNPYSGNKNFAFRIYTAQSGGSPLYTEFWNTSSQQVSLAYGGYFSVLLGSQTALTLPFDQQYWLEITVEGETLSPRYKLGSTPYTYRANITENLAANANASGNLNMNSFNILNAGNVGIGLSSPLSLLHLFQSGSNTIFNFTNGTVNSGLFVGTLSGGNAGASIGTNSNHQFRLFSNGTDRLTVDTNGNVGIGTTSPGEKLEVAGNIRIPDYGYIKTVGGDIYLAPGSGRVNIYNGTVAYNLGIYNYTSNTVWLNSNGNSWLNGGNVGIGTTGPSHTLSVYPSSSSRENGIAVAEVNANGASDAGWYINSGTNTWILAAAGAASGIGSGKFFIYENGAATPRLTIQNVTGNLGIGTTVPGAKLTVNGAGFNYGNGIRITDGGSHYWEMVHDGGAGLTFGYDGSDKFVINRAGNSWFNSGNVGIGTTSPSGTFHANGTIYFTNEGTTASAANVYTDPVTGQVFRSTSSARYKDNIRNLEVDSSLIYKLAPRTFESKSDGKTYFGLVAEEVNQHIPQLVQYDSQGRPDSVAYPMLSTLMLPEMKKMSDAVKEQQRQIEEQQKEIELLKSRIAALERR